MFLPRRSVVEFLTAVIIIITSMHSSRMSTALFSGCLGCWVVDVPPVHIPPTHTLLATPLIHKPLPHIPTCPHVIIAVCLERFETSPSVGYLPSVLEVLTVTSLICIKSFGIMRCYRGGVV